MNGLFDQVESGLGAAGSFTADAMSSAMTVAWEAAVGMMSNVFMKYKRPIVFVGGSFLIWKLGAYSTIQDAIGNMVDGLGNSLNLN